VAADSFKILIIIAGNNTQLQIYEFFVWEIVRTADEIDAAKIKHFCENRTSKANSKVEKLSRLLSGGFYQMIGYLHLCVEYGVHLATPLFIFSRFYSVLIFFRPVKVEPKGFEPLSRY